jgi:hypothetical protein
MEYEAVIGFVTYARLKTELKMWCDRHDAFGGR